MNRDFEIERRLLRLESEAPYTRDMIKANSEGIAQNGRRLINLGERVASTEEDIQRIIRDKGQLRIIVESHRATLREWSKTIERTTAIVAFLKYALAAIISIFATIAMLRGSLTSDQFDIIKFWTG